MIIRVETKKRCEYEKRRAHYETHQSFINNENNWNREEITDNESYFYIEIL